MMVNKHNSDARKETQNGGKGNDEIQYWCIFFDDGVDGIHGNRAFAQQSKIGETMIE